MRKLNKQIFLDRAKAVHGDKYDYSKSEYITVDTPLIIICEEHGEFKQSPFNHTNGAGCLKCSYENYEGSWSYSKWQKTAEKSKQFDGYKIYFIALYNENERFFKIGRTFLKITLD